MIFLNVPMDNKLSNPKFLVPSSLTRSLKSWQLLCFSVLLHVLLAQPFPPIGERYHVQRQTPLKSTKCEISMPVLRLTLPSEN